MEVKITEADLYNLTRLCRELDAGIPVMPGNFASQGQWESYVKLFQTWSQIRRKRLQQALTYANKLINNRIKECS